MRIGLIPAPKTPSGGAQPAADDPDRDLRITEAEAVFAAEHDIRELEIDRWSWPEGVFPDKEEEFELVEQYDLNISCVGLWGKNYMRSEHEEEAEKELQRALAYADEVDPEVFVTGTDVPDDLSEEEAWDQGLAFYGELIDRIRSHGYKPTFYLGHDDRSLLDYDLDHIARFLDELPEAHLKIDPANLLYSDAPPERVLAEFGDRVGHFHIKDRLNIETSDGTLHDAPPAGMGEVDWGKVTNLLYLADYEGVMAIEPHGAYWGHVAENQPRRAGVQIAQEHVAQFLKPEDRPAYLRR